MKIYIVDAFTAVPFAGNPAGVCILEEKVDDGLLQVIGMEMNLSETAFLLKQGNEYNLRWFTPTTEVELCGHATLASAHILWETGALGPGEPAIFNTLSGEIRATMKGDWIELNFPIEKEEKTEAHPLLSESLKIKPVYVGKNRFDYLIEVDSETTLRGIEPDFFLLSKVPSRGVIVTSTASSKSFDFVSRFFGPNVGINEDPVTGSAHCCLGPYWSSRLGKDSLVAYQASRRGGVVKTRTQGNRVILSGQAVTVLLGEMII